MGLLNRVRYADCRDEPWRNGAGSTRTLWRSGAAADSDARVSVARIVAAVSFSTFPGIDRTFCLLGPGGLTLVIGGAERHLQPGEWVSFAGEVPVDARPGSDPVRAINVMTARGRASHAVEPVSGPAGTAMLAALEDGAGFDSGDLILPPVPRGLGGCFLAIRIAPAAGARS